MPESDQNISPRTVTPILEARDLGRWSPRSDRWLIRHASFAVSAGDCLMITGPTGAGKSVLLRSVVALDPTDEGTILWHDQPIAAHAVPSFRSKAMYLPQRAPEFPGTALDNMRRGFELAEHAEKRFEFQQASALLKQLGRTDGFLAKQQRDLSGGERQLVALTRALLLEPQVLLLDEPTASLDRQTTQLVEQLLSDWYSCSCQARPRAIIWVSHDPRQQSTLGTQRMSMADGRLETVS